MILTPNDTLFFCEECEGYACVTDNGSNIRITPCQCQTDEV